MAHTNSTPNYNLPQFLGTDKPAWLTDINNAMSDIDTAIAAAKTTADSADTAVSALGITVGNHTSQLSTLSGAVTSQGNTLNTVTALIGNGTPTTTDQTIIGAINEINAEVNPGSVEVVADGTKTNSQLLAELWTAADTTKINVHSVLERVGASDFDVLQIDNYSSSGASFKKAFALANIASIYTAEIGTTGSYKRCEIGSSSSSFTDMSSIAPGSGTKFKLYY